jgi:hypothetical protein
MVSLYEINLYNSKYVQVTTMHIDFLELDMKI